MADYPSLRGLSMTGVASDALVSQTSDSAELAMSSTDESFDAERSPISSLPISRDLLGENNRYQLVGRLGKGGMGVVFQAKDTLLERPVAIKFVRHERAMDPSANKRLLKEARLAARLHHSSIAQVLDVGTAQDERAFVVFEYIEGLTLAELLAEEGVLTPDLVQRLAIQICSGLQAAHGRDVFHRDLKPSNLMCRGGGQDVEVKILDFGIARDDGGDEDSVDTATATTSVGGTPHYLSPEVAKGASSGDARSDIYSLGCVLYELLSGQKAHDGSSRNAIIYSVTRGRVRPLSEVAPDDVSPELCRLVDSCLRVEPESRPATETLLSDLRRLRVLSDETPPSREEGRGKLLIPGLALLATVSVGFFAAVGHGTPRTAIKETESSKAATPVILSAPAKLPPSQGELEPPQEVPHQQASEPDIKPQREVTKAVDSTPRVTPSKKKKSLEPRADERTRSVSEVQGFETENPYQ